MADKIRNTENAKLQVMHQEFHDIWSKAKFDIQSFREDNNIIGNYKEGLKKIFFKSKLNVGFYHNVYDRK